MKWYCADYDNEPVNLQNLQAQLFNCTVTLYTTGGKINNCEKEYTAYCHILIFNTTKDYNTFLVSCFAGAVAYGESLHRSSGNS